MTLTSDSSPLAESDMPALADASDCDTSCSGEDGSKSQSQFGNRDQCAASVSSTVAVASVVSSVPRDKELPLPNFEEESGNQNLSSGCASLFCISELLSSWGGDSSKHSRQRFASVDSRDSKRQDTTAGHPNTMVHSDSVNSVNSIDSGMAQRLIQLDIQKHMCCSEGYWRKEEQNLDSPFPCGYSRYDASERCERCNGITLPIQRIGNRNVCMPKKARMRIDFLRESGLGRDFSLAPVSHYLEEEVFMMQKEREGTGTETKKKGWLNSHPRQREGTRTETKKGWLNSHPRQREGTRTETKKGWLNSHPRPVSPPIRPSQSMDLSSRQKKSRGKDLLLNDSLGSRQSYSQSLCQCQDRGLVSPTYKSIGLLEVMSALGVSSGRATSAARTQTMVSVPSFDSVQSDVELCYDSDPGAERNISNRLNRYENDLEEAAVNPSREERTVQSVELDSLNMIDPSLDRQRIAELASGTYTFIWHPNLQKHSHRSPSTSPPLWVSSYFEMGSCLKTTLVQPKFVWRTVSQPSGQSSVKQSLKTIQAPASVELLNIVRILSPSTTSVDRNIYPFVKSENAFILVTTTKDEYLFEAKNEDQKKKFVYCMKLMIARLASKIIVGDRDVFNEFFDPLGKRIQEVQASKAEEASVANGRVGSMCTTIVAPVNAESDRNDELWGR